MLIRREVYFSAYDEDGEERLYSTTELISEEEYLSEIMYSEDEDKKDKKKMRWGDKVIIGSNKHLSYGKYRKAQIDELDDDKETARKGRRNLAKENAKIVGIGGALGGAVSGAKVGGVKGAAIGATIGATGAGAAYVGSRLDSKYKRFRRNASSNKDAKSRRMRDQLKVSDGQMSKEEFIEKYGRYK